MLDPPWWAVVPACARPCHRWLITPLSRNPWARRILVAGMAVLAVYAGVPALLAAGGALAVLALPRIPEATFILFAFGLPIRLLRWAARVRRTR